jgi:hypothetical protein
MLDRIKTLSPLPVRWYVTGSDHGDHTGGNAALPKDIRMITRAGLNGDEQSIDVGGTIVRVADWFLREQQAPIAVRKVYEEIEGRSRVRQRRGLFALVGAHYSQ